MKSVRRWFQRYWLEGLLAVALLAAVGYFAWIGWGLLPKRSVEVPLVFSGDRAYAHVVAQTDIGPRPSGSDGIERERDYIMSHLIGQGWNVITQTFSYSDTVVTNIVGRLGEGPTVVIGAHYDTRREADSDPDPLKRQEMVLGANDGASGTAVLLELAQVLDRGDLQNEVWLAFFDAEDNGGLDDWDWAIGSGHMASEWAAGRAPTSDRVQPAIAFPTPVPLPEFLILVDMVGDADQNIYMERNSSLDLTEAIWARARELGYEEFFVPEFKWQVIDDHTPFLEIGVSAVDIIDLDYPYWHTTEDTPDKISAASLQRVGAVLEAFLEHQGWED
ncbi:MAG TPA: M28 family peptidase [Anaerolineae bacterium]|nr:M28 family peptidase [Anaerolineae bacterium]